MFILNAVGLGSPFDALYDKVTEKIIQAQQSGTPISLGTKHLLGRKIIVLKLELTSSTDQIIAEKKEIWIYCKKYWTCEEWKTITPLIDRVTEFEEYPIESAMRPLIERLIDGETVASADKLLRLQFLPE